MKTSERSDIKSRVQAKVEVNKALESHGSNVLTTFGRNNLLLKTADKVLTKPTKPKPEGRRKRTPGPTPSF